MISRETTLKEPEQLHVKIVTRKMEWRWIERFPFKSQQRHLTIVKLFTVSEKNPRAISLRNKDTFCLFK